MKNYNVYMPPYMPYFDGIVGRKISVDEKAYIEGLRQDVEERYNEFLNKFDGESLHLITDSLLGNEEGAALRGMYVYRSLGVSEIRKNILSIQGLSVRQWCPYCGVRPHDSLDHYLPKERYPEFSCLLINLIPCCTSCNRKKGEKWREDGVKEIINFYLDFIFDDQFLFCEIQGVGEEADVSFYLDFDAIVDNDKSLLIQRHFKNLGLIELYNDSSSSEIADIVDEFSAHGTKVSVVEVREYLERLLERKIERYGRNSWRCCLLSGVIENDDFVRYLSELCLDF